MPPAGLNYDLWLGPARNGRTIHRICISPGAVVGFRRRSPDMACHYAGPTALGPGAALAAVDQREGQTTRGSTVPDLLQVDYHYSQRRCRPCI
jgi:hypothetical protein